MVMRGQQITVSYDRVNRVDQFNQKEHHIYYTWFMLTWNEKLLQM